MNWASKKRQGRLIFTVAFLGCAMAVGLAELLFRWVPLPVFAAYDVPHMYEADPVLGFRLRSDGRWLHRTEEFSVEVRTNSYGHRTGGNSPRPREGKGTRILFLGDSMVFGWGVRWEETCVARVSEHLRRRLERPVTAINAGVPGYGIADYEAVMAAAMEGKRPPDFVVVGIFGQNDFQAWRAKEMEVVDGLLLGKPQPASSGLRHLVARRSRIYYLVWRMRNNVLDQDRRPLPAIYERPWSPSTRQSFEAASETLRRMYRKGSGADVGFAIVLIPSKLELSPGYWEGQGRKHLLKAGHFPPSADMNAWRLELRSRLDEAGIPWIDLFAGVERAEAQSPGRLYYSRDSHWTEEGNGVAASLVASALAEMIIAWRERPSSFERRTDEHVLGKARGLARME